MSAEVHITFLTETCGFFSFTHDGTVTMNAYLWDGGAGGESGAWGLRATPTARSETRPIAHVNITTPNASKTFGSANAGVRDGCRPSIANWPTNSVVNRPRQTNDMNW